MSDTPITGVEFGHPDNNAQAIIDAAIGAAETELLLDNRFAVVRAPAGSETRVLDLHEMVEKSNASPHRRKGTVKMHTPAALAEFTNRHSTGATEVYADVLTSTITAVLNAGTGINDDAATEHGGVPGWGDYRAVFNVQFTPAWKAWIGYDGKLVDQHEFAEHLEARLPDLESPSPAEMLEIAMTFEAKQGVDFKQAERLESGERKFVYDETIAAKAGQKGDITIPETFTILVQPFEGASAFRMTARLRYRISAGGLRIGYKLDRPEDVLREAFDDVTQVVRTNLAEGVPVFDGSPA